MADLSLNLEIKGIGNTTISMADAKKLYSELKVLFEEKVTYVPTYGWRWNYPWWNNIGWYESQYGAYKSTKSSGGVEKYAGDTGVSPSSYSVSI